MKKKKRDSFPVSTKLKKTVLGHLDSSEVNLQNRRLVKDWMANVFSNKRSIDTYFIVLKQT